MSTRQHDGAEGDGGEKMDEKQEDLRTLGQMVAFHDHAEADVLKILRRSKDLSAGSDELAMAAESSSIRYHLAAERDHLLRPFELRPGQRVLEIGAGCGALTRYLGETGAEVVALEGVAERARVVSRRCADLPNVEVVAGALEAFADGDFDVAVAVGVLEWAGSREGGESTPQRFLELLRATLHPSGVALLAIENQIGIKYLLGHPEDHLGAPWVGLAGYPAARGVRTYPRRILSKLLSAAGLPVQRWHFPFPDYKFPKMVLSEEIYRTEDAPRLVDQLVRAPAGAPALDSPAIEARAFHEVLLEAGLGDEVASSFLVVASAAEAEVAAMSPPERLAWGFSSGRTKCWRWMRTLERHTEGCHFETVPLQKEDGARHRDWLKQVRKREESFRHGPTLERLAREACRSCDLDRLREVLGSWDAYLTEAEVPAPESEPHPYRPESLAQVLPGDHLDIDLSNFIVADDGKLIYIDDEWRAAGGVDGTLVRLRALWNLSRDLVAQKSVHPWDDQPTIDELACRLAELIGIEASSDELKRLRRAEAAFLHLVTGREGKEIERELAHQGGWHGPPERSVAATKALSKVLREAHETDRKIYENEILKQRGYLEEAETKIRDLAAELESKSVQLHKARDNHLDAQKDYEEEISRLGKLLEAEHERQGQGAVGSEDEVVEARAELRRVLGAHEASSKAYEEEISRLHEKLEGISELRHELDHSYADHDAAKLAYGNEINKLQLELNGMSETLAAEREMASSTRQELETLIIAERSAAEDARSELRKAHTANRSAQESYEGEIGQLTRALEDSEGKVYSLGQALEALSAEHRELAETLERSYQSHSSASAVYETEIEHRGNDLNRLGAELAQVGAEHERSLQEAAGLRAERSHLITRLAQVEGSRLWRLRTSLLRRWRALFG